jgi:hypothetical protein
VNDEGNLIALLVRELQLNYESTHDGTDERQKTAFSLVKILLRFRLQMEGCLTGALIGAGFDLDLILCNDLFDDFSESCRLSILSRAGQINCSEVEGIGEDRGLGYYSNLDTGASTPAGGGGSVGRRGSRGERGERFLRLCV